jgi:hypothetical protein
MKAGSAFPAAGFFCLLNRRPERTAPPVQRDFCLAPVIFYFGHNWSENNK